ncbi:MAG: HEAT repeat domain-containing protein [Chloroflexi bacterium]|jgi:HEAT repeat protein|nr:HEAT repeat domain-containing protein [Chloroflexota bacterium]
MGFMSLGDLLASSREERLSAENLYKDIVETLIEMAGDDEAEVRAAAAKAMGMIAEKKVVPALKEALKDADKDVRAAATEALGKIAARMQGSITPEAPNKIS